MAWRTPPVMMSLLNNAAERPAGSMVLRAQSRLVEATRAALAAVNRDVRAGLLETVGIDSALMVEERTSVVIEVPPEADREIIARAIDMENVEAWCDEHRRVHVAIGPWYSTKDVDQVVLSTTKVVHVLLGLHASNVQDGQSKGFLQKLLASILEVLLIQKRLAHKKDQHSD